MPATGTDRVKGLRRAAYRAAQSGDDAGEPEPGVLGTSETEIHLSQQENQP
jgi:hypothetical protein